MRINVKVTNLEALSVDKIKKAVLKANVKLYNDCVDGTPVDTGFARASWWPQVDHNPATHPNPPSVEDPSATPPNAAAFALGVGRLFSVVNSAAYIRRLEYDGHSAQNVGWVQRAAAAYPANLRSYMA